MFIRWYFTKFEFLVPKRNATWMRVQIISSQKQLGRLNCIIGDENKNKIVITWQSSNVGPNRNIDFSKTNKPFQIKHSWNILFLGLFEKYLFFVCVSIGNAT